MKIVTILGTRPEIIRLSRILPLLDSHCEHFLVHTAQNFDKNLSDIFFHDFRLKAPSEILESRSNTVMEQIGKILVGCESILTRLRPDRVLLLGDTNSSLSSLVAKRLGVPVFHMEAGNRCYDDRVPEEVNRRVIDHSSDLLLPYTEGSKRNLIREGIPSDRIVVSGNPIFEVLNYYSREIESSKVLENHKLVFKEYFLVTLHRSENVDHSERLKAFIEALTELHSLYGMPVILSVHPRTRSKLKEAQLDTSALNTIDPPGFFDFVKLQKNAFCVLTDSGTVQEEACILKVPSIVLRDVTERPETIEAGATVLTGAHKKSILDGVSQAVKKKCEWNVPREYLVPNVSQIVTELLLRKK